MGDDADRNKAYASMGGNHSAIDAVKALGEENALRAEEIEEIIVEVTESMVHHAGWKYQPNGVTAAQMNLGFAVATQIIEGDVFVEQMIEANIGRPDLVALAQRVNVVRSIKREAKGTAYRWGCDVTIRLKSGKELKKTVDWAWGSVKYPLSNDQIKAKYRRLASKTLSEEKVSLIEREMGQLSSLSSIDSLLGALRQ